MGRATTRTGCASRPLSFRRGLWKPASDGGTAAAAAEALQRRQPPHSLSSSPAVMVRPPPPRLTSCCWGWGWWWRQASRDDAGGGSRWLWLRWSVVKKWAGRSWVGRLCSAIGVHPPEQLLLFVFIFSFCYLGKAAGGKEAREPSKCCS